MTTQRDDGGPVHPVRIPIPGALHANDAPVPTELHTGITLRDEFAKTALPPVMYVCVNDTLADGETRAELFARKAYEMADAMLKARQL